MEIRDVLPRDAIPSIDQPSFGRSYFGDPDDEVVVLESDPPRAYPVRILSYHEVVNDVIPAGQAAVEGGPDARGGRPVAVTWCPICWSGAVYDRRVDGRTLTFGVSGKLADDALVLYDRETGTEWNQPTGAALAGPLEGASLQTLPAAQTTWAEFERAHPEGRVLQPVRGGDPGSARREYDMEPYDRYASGEGFGLAAMRGIGEPRTWDRDDVDPKTHVLGIEHGGEAVGYPLPRVRDAGGLLTDSVGDLEIVVVLRDGDLFAYEAPGSDVELTEDGLRADGTVWDVVSGRRADGRGLVRVPAHRLFAFAWQDAHGPDAFYE